MACRLCAQILPLRTIEQLNKDIDSGQSSMAQIAEVYDVDVKYVATHIKKCRAASSNNSYSLLQDLLSVLNTTAAEMRQSYDPETNPFAMGHFVKLAREIRETTVALTRLRPSSDLLRRVSELILGPLIHEFSAIVVEEGDHLRTELIDALGQDQAARVDRAVKSLTLRMADRYKRKTEALLPKLKDLLEDDLQKKKRSPSSQNPRHTS